MKSIWRRLVCGACARRVANFAVGLFLALNMAPLVGAQLCSTTEEQMCPNAPPCPNEPNVQFVPDQTARDCGCRGKEIPCLPNPELADPHYVNAGSHNALRGNAAACNNSPKLPDGGLYGYVRYSQLASLDLFEDHDWHDFNIFVKLLGDGYKLNSSANYKNCNCFLEYTGGADDGLASQRGEALLEVEWDTKHYDQRFWATAGDKVWMTGRYIWDCGHPNGYHNEIHPPTAIALTRLEPHVAPGGTLSLTNKTYIYIHGKSGLKDDYYQDAPVANRDYIFDIELPAKPAAAAVPFKQVLEIPFGGPAPELSEIFVENGKYKVRVTYRLNFGDFSPDRKFGAVVLAGWLNSQVNFRRIKVEFDKIVINKRHHPTCQADWKLWLNVNGRWVRVEGLYGVNNGTTIPLRGNPKYTFEVLLPDTPDARLTIQASGWVNFYDFAFGSGLSLLEAPIKYPQMFSAFMTKEGGIGLFFKQYRRDGRLAAQPDEPTPFGAFGIGDHGFAEPKNGEHSRRTMALNGKSDTAYRDTDRDFTLYYRITEIP